MRALICAVITAICLTFAIPSANTAEAVDKDGDHAVFQAAKKKKRAKRVKSKRSKAKRRAKGKKKPAEPPAEEQPPSEDE